MKIVRFSYGNETKHGILYKDAVQSIVGTPYGIIEAGSDTYRINEIKLLAPVVPSKIVALGLNYLSHAKEFNFTVPEVPLFFIKPSTSVIGPGDNIVYPSSSRQVDYEAELGVVIKKPARYISEKEARDYILGYTCVNDVTARDQQKKDGQWTRAKSYDTFAPIGPHIETDLNPENTIVESYLNGTLKQRANTSDLIFSVPRLVSFISGVMTLLPGDIIATGTPSGIGPMTPGDTIEVKISGVGSLINHVVRSLH